MAGLSDSKVRESKVTPRALHKTVIRAGNPSRVGFGLRNV